MNKTQVKVVTRYLGECAVGVCVLNMKGEEIERFLPKDFCCENTMYAAILKYIEKNNMIEIHNEVV